MKKISIVFIILISLASLILAGCDGIGITPGTNIGNPDTLTMGNGNGNSNNNPSTNNPNSNNYQEPIEVDDTKPIIIGFRDPIPNSFGWNNTDVVISFVCEDIGPVQSGIVVNTVEGEIVTTEGENQSVTNTGECIDAAGNIADSVTISNINIDKKAPQVTITLPGNGEYNLNESVAASWSATDTLSGVVSPASGTLQIDTSSTGTKTITLPAGTATDKAGNNSLKVTKSYLVIADSVEPGTGDEGENPGTNNPADPNTVYPQKWATGDGTESNPWANDCIQKAYDAVPEGGTIYLRAGYYVLVDEIMILKRINIIGEGRNETIIKTANKDGFYIFGIDYITIKNLTIDGNAQTNGTLYQGGIIFSGGNYMLVENVEVKNCGYYGIDIYQVNHSSFKNIYSHDNYREGMHPGSNDAGRNKYNTYQNIYAYNNGFSGFDDRGISEGGNSPESSYNVYDNIQAWGNGFHGIYIAYQNNISLSNSSARDNGSKGGWVFGIHIQEVEDSIIDNCTATSNNVKGIGITSSRNIDINDCLSTFNNAEGINLETSKDINLSDVIVKNNGTGLHFDIVSNILLSSCQSYDDRNTPLQDYGLELNNSDTGISLLNCKLSPNQFGEIYNPSGIAVTINTDKLLAKF